MSELKLKMLAYNYLVIHIFECEKVLEKVTLDSTVSEYKTRIEVYKYLIKLIKGDAKDD